MLMAALLIPPALLCAVLTLGRWEEVLLGPAENAPDPLPDTPPAPVRAPAPVARAGAAAPSRGAGARETAVLPAPRSAAPGRRLAPVRAPEHARRTGRHALSRA